MELTMKYQPGQSGNPAGRPPGSRNKKTIAIEEAFEEHAEDVLKEVVGRAKEGEKTAMRLCMERMLAPKRERPVAIDLPVIETPADARKALAVVTAELAEGSLTITEATRLIGLIQRMLRLVGDIEKMEKAGREAEEAKALGRSVRASMDAFLAQDEATRAPAEATQTAAPASARDPSLYFPVNSENVPAPDGSRAGPGGTGQAGEPSAEAPLARAA
jgi:Family of unknown function (DUF5681)